MSQLSQNQLGQAQAMTALQQNNSLSQILGSANCVSAWHQCTCTTRYVHADISIDRAENGFLVTIKGKRYVAATSADVARVIDEAK